MWSTPYAGPCFSPPVELSQHERLIAMSLLCNGIVYFRASRRILSGSTHTRPLQSTRTLANGMASHSALASEHSGRHVHHKLHPKAVHLCCNASTDARMPTATSLLDGNTLALHATQTRNV